ncbi:MAG: hypothetical protein ABL949_15000 [Fimbriimonadaceae bacterium]
MSNKTKMALLAAVSVVAIAIPLTMTTSIAQEQTKPPVDQQGNPPPAQGGFGNPPQGGPGQGGPGQGGPGSFRPGQGGQGGMMMGGGGGGTAMVEDGSNLFILQGNRVFKLSKSDLKVVAQGELPRPQMPGGPGGGGGDDKAVPTPSGK